MNVSQPRTAMPLEDMAAAALARPPSERALEYRGHWYTRGDLQRVADGVGSLIESSGCDPRAAIAFMPRTRPSAIAALVGLIAKARTVRMIYPYQNPPGIIRHLDRLNAAVLVGAEEDFSDELRAALRERGIAAVALREMDASAIPGLERSHADAYIETRARPQIETLTSGTTGPPKQFPLDYDLIASHMIGTWAHESGKAGASSADDTPILHYSPLGNFSGVHGSTRAIQGKALVVIDRFNVSDWHDYVRRYRPTSLGIPAVGFQMVLEANLPREDLSSIKVMSTGAAPLDPHVHRRFEDHYGIPILLGYGATEFVGSATQMTLDLYRQWRDKKFGSVGRAVPGVQLRVIDRESGAVLPPGREGVLEALAAHMGPDWIRTSDLVLIDEDGFMFHRGRADGAINRGGFKLLPETIEQALLLHPAISAVVVVGIPDKRLGQVPAAVIEVKASAQRPSIADLEAHLRNHVLATHIPAAWHFGEIPRTPSMKADRGASRRLFESDAARE